MSFQHYANSFLSRLHTCAINKKAAIGICALVVIIIAVLASSFFSATGSGGVTIARADESQSAETADESTNAQAPQAEKICVHIAGAVVHPGICSLDAGSRVADAIEAVGGFAEGAATESINLARQLEDGEQIIVASAEEIERAAFTGDVVPKQSQQTQGGRININTATSEELQTISGIGEAKAKKIIEYREKHGSFKTIEDITNVSGFGEKTLENLKEYICV